DADGIQDQLRCAAAHVLGNSLVRDLVRERGEAGGDRPAFRLGFAAWGLLREGDCAAHGCPRDYVPASDQAAMSTPAPGLSTSGSGRGGHPCCRVPPRTRAGGSRTPLTIIASAAHGSGTRDRHAR